MTRIRYQISIFIWFVVGVVSSGFSQSNRAVLDSAFWYLSLPEIQSYSTYYTQELEQLQKEKQYLIRRGIEDGEHLLKTNPDHTIIDEILIRLADLYYYSEKDDYLLKMNEYDNQLLLYDQGTVDNEPEAPRLYCKRSLEIYQRLIDEFPQSEMVDDAVYNKAFLFEEIGENQKANQVYLYLIDAYPNSKYVPEAFIRLGEYFFNPPVNDLSKAINNYKAVLRYKSSLRYEEALYKLGWSYYRLSQFPEAISYFTTLVENFDAVSRYDSLAIGVRLDLRTESVDYIAISFLDFGGPAKLLEYLKNIGEPEWGEEALEKMGDVYMEEKEELHLAIPAYQAYLNYASSSPGAPIIQRKIVDCFIALNDSRNAFTVRKNLFENYNSESKWWAQIRDEKVKLQAYRITENALRENFNTILKHATDDSDQSLYREVVELGKIYLSSFPEDLYAYFIRWNVALILDTKLYRYKEALQEYLTISMVYNGQRYEKFAREKGISTIQDAAENAIVVADSLVRQESRSLEYPVAERSAEKRESIPLTTAESWLAMAYDNYLKLFPFDQNTPKILANAGVLYFTRNQFTEALKYFKTLTEYFPDSDQIQTVQYSILESYFGKKDYKSVEFFAKRMLTKKISDEIKRKANRRLGEAIFLNAQVLAGKGEFAGAANEYYRMALEVPTMDFADRALFNSAREYERVGEYQSAIRAYELLRTSYSGSSLILDALNNLAFDYGELGEYHMGGERYEALANLVRSGEREKDAIYNAYVFYNKAESWHEAIRMADVYTSNFPDAEDASWIYFQIGKFHQHLQDFESAAKFYSSFSVRFPKSPLAVEAFYRAGKYYFDEDKLSTAENYFQQAFSMSERIKSMDLDENPFYAAEALFLASQIQYDRYKQIKFSLPLETQNRTVQHKESLLRELQKQYARVASYGTHRLPESVYRIGALYENFAVTLVNQEIPFMDATSRAVKEKEINERTTQIYGQALAGFQRATKIIKTLVDQPDLTIGVSDTLAGIPSDTIYASSRAWMDKAQEKVSETLFQMAEVNTRSIDRLMEAPIPQDLGVIARFEYRNQVLLKAIKPLLDIVVEAHHRNLIVSDSLELNNQWTEASRVKIIYSLNLFAEKYRDLSFDALDTYRHLHSRFCMTSIQNRNEIPEDLATAFINMIDLSKSYSKAVVAFYWDAVNRANKIGIGENEILRIQDQMVQFALQIADSLERIIAEGEKDRQKADDLYQESGDSGIEEILITLEDNIYFLTENMQAVLEAAYTVEEGFTVASPSRGWLGVRMVKMDPETYSTRLNIPVLMMSVSGDSTWWFTGKYHEEWESPDFQMKGWYRNGQFSRAGTTPEAPVQQVAILDSLARHGSVFVRKEITIPGYPVSGTVTFQNNPPDNIFLNGKRVTEKKEYTQLPLNIFLRESRNLLAIQWSGVYPFINESEVTVHYIPEHVLPESERKK